MRAFSQGAAQSARQAQGHEWGPGTSSLSREQWTPSSWHWGVMTLNRAPSLTQ